jgi:hypothetical protein
MPAPIRYATYAWVCLLHACTADPTSTEPSTSDEVRSAAVPEYCTDAAPEVDVDVSTVTVGGTATLDGETAFFGCLHDEVTAHDVCFDSGGSVATLSGTYDLSVSGRGDGFDGWLDVGVERGVLVDHDMSLALNATAVHFSVARREGAWEQGDEFTAEYGYALAFDNPQEGQHSIVYSWDDGAGSYAARAGAGIYDISTYTYGNGEVDELLVSGADIAEGVVIELGVAHDRAELQGTFTIDEEPVESEFVSKMQPYEQWYYLEFRPKPGVAAYSASERWAEGTLSYEAEVPSGVYDIFVLGANLWSGRLASGVTITPRQTLDFSVQTVPISCTFTVEGAPGDVSSLILADPEYGDVLYPRMDREAASGGDCSFQAWPGSYDVYWQRDDFTWVRLGASVDLTYPRALHLDYAPVTFTATVRTPELSQEPEAGRAFLRLTSAYTGLEFYALKGQDGAYSSTVPPDVYTVEVLDRTGAQLVAERQDVMLNTSVILDAPRCPVTGTIRVDGDGAPEVGSFGAATVVFTDVATGLDFTFSLESGQATFSVALPPGDYDVDFTMPGSPADDAVARGRARVATALHVGA